MTWPDGIALTVGITAAFLLTHTPHPHRSTTRTQHRTEADHGRQHGRPQEHPDEEDRGEEDAREEDGPVGPEDGR